MDPKRLTLIQGGNKPPKHRARRTKDSSVLLQCPKCGGTMFQEMWRDPMEKNGRILKRSGLRIVICARCWRDGEVVRVGEY